MTQPHTQIFQTQNDTRWKRIKWSVRILLFIALFFISVLMLALYRGFTPSLPNLEERSRVFQNKLDPTNPLTFAHSQNKKIKGFKDFLAHKDSIEINRPLNEAANKLPFMRAVFYTPWTAKTALPELNQYGDRINSIFPEWYFIDSNTHRPEARIDSAGYALMQQKKLRILPMLSNFNSGLKDFDGGLVHDILTNANKRSLFIRELADSFTAHRFQGVNVDFEELAETSSAPLTQFMKELHASFHERGLWVTMDVAPYNDDYDLKSLAPYCDYVVLMAYDQYSQNSDPGPVSAQKWIEAAMDWANERIEADKIILGMAAYGYDWTKGKKQAAVYTYNDAINKAKLVRADIDYDNDSYNLHYRYSDEETADDGTKTIRDHEVWFTDAATLFNILRFNDAFGTAGTAIWRLGGEDSRIWNFYNRSLSNESLQEHPFDFQLLEHIPIIPNSVQLVGQGELLNILYKPQEGRLKLEIDSAEQLIAEQQYQTLPSGYVIQKFAEDSTEGKGHKLILTFDDGPSEVYTPQILDILEKEKVPASFFVVGLEAEQNIPLLQRIHADGFEIGNHTFTHNNIAKMSPQRAAVEMKLTRLLIECITGRSTILFRAPYNADSEPQTFEELEPIARSRQENYLTVGESIDPNDWEPHVTADTIFQRVLKQVQERNASIILLHDAGGDSRQATVDALPRIIHYFKERGYRFTTIADLMHKTSADVMPPIPPSRDSWLITVNFFLAEATYWGSHFIYALFLVGIFLSIG
ncbi:MAG TPA: polysaccharide deacetylase family protein, partial [Ferruginibacter sp.]|nr:polysaccharide deacetylase family protein [Ferruginibacter sp.]